MTLRPESKHKNEFSFSEKTHFRWFLALPLSLRKLKQLRRGGWWSAPTTIQRSHLQRLAEARLSAISAPPLLHRITGLSDLFNSLFVSWEKILNEISFPNTNCLLINFLIYRFNWENLCEFNRSFICEIHCRASEFEETHLTQGNFSLFLCLFSEKMNENIMLMWNLVVYVYIPSNRLLLKNRSLVVAFYFSLDVGINVFLLWIL